MPRITEPTVKEHHEMRRRRLIDAAEELLRANPSDTLTAAAVAERAGIARNSIYRYVDSVDELYAMVVLRHMPAWKSAVEGELGQLSDPMERIHGWVRANLQQAQGSGHGWLRRVARMRPLADSAKESLAGVHRELSDVPVRALRELQVQHPATLGSLMSTILDGGFARLDAGDALEDVERFVIAAVTAIITEDRPA